MVVAIIPQRGIGNPVSGKNRFYPQTVAFKRGTLDIVYRYVSNKFLIQKCVNLFFVNKLFCIP